jgi:alkylresorcinol/alkylpyrone synthase
MTKRAVKILSVAKELPEFSRKTEDILPYIDAWLSGHDERFKDKVKRIFKYAQVDKRYGIMDIDEVFRNTSFEDKNEYFNKKNIELSQRALESALLNANLKPTDIDVIITVSCTGFMIPSVDAHIINNLRMRQDIIRLPVTEMGCAAGVSGLIYAYNFLKDNPEKRAAVIAMESPTSTFQHNDFSMTNIVSAAIFGDGAACAILGASDELKPAIRDVDMYHFYDELDMMGFKLRNSGLQMILAQDVPEKIEKHFEQILIPFLERNDLKLKDVDHFIFHPGGKKIVQITEAILKDLGKNIEDTKQVLKDYGNMSSATVLYVLENFMNKAVKEGETGLVLSFGPGFSAQRILLEWQH